MRGQTPLRPRQRHVQARRFNRKRRQILVRSCSSMPITPRQGAFCQTGRHLMQSIHAPKTMSLEFRSGGRCLAVRRLASWPLGEARQAAWTPFGAERWPCDEYTLPTMWLGRRLRPDRGCGAWRATNSGLPITTPFEKRRSRPLGTTTRSAPQRPPRRASPPPRSARTPSRGTAGSPARGRPRA